MEEVLEFDCPRCHTPSAEQFYGPCTRCREQLRQAESGARRDAVAADYVPKMNVTPNAVALKDD